MCVIVNILDILSLLLILGIFPTAWLVYKKRIKFLNGVFIGTFLFLLSFGCPVYLTQLLYGYSPIDLMVNSTIDGLAESYNSLPGITADQSAKMGQLMDAFKNMYFVLMPTVVVISNLFWSYLLLVLSKGVFALFRKDVSGFGKFCDFKMSRSALVLGIVAYILSAIFDGHQISYGFMNFSSIIFIVTSFCGFSMIDFWLRKKVKYSVLRALIYIVGLGTLSLFMGIGTSLLLFVGIADASFDFRKGPSKTKRGNE